ncbi:hypothetical protein EV421DRAFT_1732634 [Armillaria borealis]|uniref:Uncharacterized protein n=1 Tax=Armillaria borealis TaxID=47425 RepID=A0AA39JUV7_9AGAR|nr:hypothetical protein EV421DRAFT_1732634 [Armillaria borealis]
MLGILMEEGRRQLGVSGVGSHLGTLEGWEQIVPLSESLANPYPLNLLWFDGTQELRKGEKTTTCSSRYSDTRCPRIDMELWYYEGGPSTFKCSAPDIKQPQPKASTPSSFFPSVGKNIPYKTDGGGMGFFRNLGSASQPRPSSIIPDDSISRAPSQGSKITSGHINLDVDPDDKFSNLYPEEEEQGPADREGSGRKGSNPREPAEWGRSHPRRGRTRSRGRRRSRTRDRDEGRRDRQ